jgi:hypothetical protein
MKLDILIARNEQRWYESGYLWPDTQPDITLLMSSIKMFTCQWVGWLLILTFAVYEVVWRVGVKYCQVESSDCLDFHLVPNFD